MPKKEHLALAEKIITKAEITESEVGIDINLISVIGYRQDFLLGKGWKKKQKQAAIDEYTEFIANEIGKGNLVLADDFEKVLANKKNE